MMHSFFRFGWTGLVWASLLLAAGTSAAATYQVGAVVNDFTLVNRRLFYRDNGEAVPPGSTIRLSDFNGKIVFLEWFAHWCPFCQAAARATDPGIDEYYSERGGNPAGIPVVHLAVNLQRNQDASTEAFLDSYGLEMAADDYTATTTWVVRNSFFSENGQPLFAIINCVAGSPSHDQYELLARHAGYGQSNFSAKINEWRAVIDSVQAPPARLSSPRIDGNHFRFQFTGLPGGIYTVERSIDLQVWQPLTMVTNQSGTAIFWHTNALGMGRAFYRLAE